MHNPLEAPVNGARRGAPLRRFINEFELAEILSVSPKSLRRWRLEGRGPVFRKFGSGRSAAVRYSLDDVETWIQEQPAGGWEVVIKEKRLAAEEMSGEPRCFRTLTLNAS